MSCARYFNPKLRFLILIGFEPAWLLKHPRRSYIRAAVLAAPVWVDREVLKALRTAAKTARQVTGVEHVLDHIVPLNHPYVCGLHVPWNLRIVTRAVNAYKSNKWSPDQMEMFP